MPCAPSELKSHLTVAFFTCPVVSLVAVAMISVLPNDMEILELCPQAQLIVTLQILVIPASSTHLDVGDEDEYNLKTKLVWSMSTGVQPS
jgi:hypothetical protein